MKKGFTLIELLAVILILGIIALIAIPTVNNIIKSSKEESFKVSSNNILNSVINDCNTKKLKNEKINTTYVIEDGVSTSKIEVKGNLPIRGIINLDSDCNVSFNLTNGNFISNKNTTDETVDVIEGTFNYKKYNDGQVVYFNPVTGSKCLLADYTANTGASNTGKVSGCMKWYAFNDLGSSVNTLNLLLDHNTTATVAYNTLGDANTKVELQTALNNNTSTWTSGLNPRIINDMELAKITKFDTFKSESFKSYYFDTLVMTESTSCKSGNVSGCKYGWLYDRTDTTCTTYGCLNNANTPASMLGYWVDSVANNTGTFSRVVTGGAFTAFWPIADGTAYGLRPVITINKSVLN